MPEPNESLSSLRNEIDAVDRAIVEQLAQRDRIIARIAAYKIAHALPLRDRERERELLSDRESRATELGLNPRTVESLFRTVLASSRDRLAALRVGLPAATPPRRIAIIGGHGGMGRLFGRLLAELGHEIIAVDLGTAVTPEQAAAAADVTIVSVPIDATVEVIGRVAGCMREDRLLMDLTSIKSEPVRAMLGHGSCGVIGAHPLFGPSVHTVQGQRLVLCPARAQGWLDWTRQTFEALGMIIVEATPEEHDRIMSVVQVLTHFATEVTGATLTALGIPIERTLEFTSPVYQMELYMTARHFAQSPDLYACIQMSNPGASGVMQAFVAAAERQRDAVAAGDRAAFRELFARVNRQIGPLSARALAESGYLIDRLVERS